MQGSSKLTYQDSAALPLQRAAGEPHCAGIHWAKLCAARAAVENGAGRGAFKAEKNERGAYSLRARLRQYQQLFPCLLKILRFPTVKVLGGELRGSVVAEDIRLVISPKMKPHRSFVHS